MTDTQELIAWLSEREQANAARGDQESAQDCREMQDLVRRRYDEGGR